MRSAEQMIEEMLEEDRLAEEAGLQNRALFLATGGDGSLLKRKG